MYRSVLLAGAVFALGAHGPAQGGEVLKLTSPDSDADDKYGFFVAISGDTGIVGAVGDDDGGMLAGAAYIYQRDWGGPGNWGQVVKLHASDAAPAAYLGHVSLDGDTAVVGAYGDEDQGNDTGSAYVFMRDWGGVDNWGEVAKIVASDPEAFDAFGHDVAVCGGTAVIGALGNDDACPADPWCDSGAAYVYERHLGGDDNWGQVKKLVPSDTAQLDNFGRVEISGDTIIVGSFKDDDGATNAGSVYVFERNAGGAENWGEVGKVTASDPSNNAQFGQSVSISGDTMVVGAPFEGSAATEAGAVYVFYRNQKDPNAWDEIAKITAFDAAIQDNYGRDVSIDGDTVVVGSPNDDDAGSASGSIYVHRRDEGGADNWGLVAKHTASDGAPNNYLGRGVGVSCDMAIAGAWGDNYNGTATGSAYLFETPGACVCPADLDGDGVIAFPDLLALLAAWGDAGGDADLDGSGEVDFNDLLIMLAAWGPCVL